MKRYAVYEYKDGELCWVWTQFGLKEAQRLAKESYLAGMETVRIVDEETGVVEYIIGE